MRYPRDRIFAKDYEFLSFAKNMGKKIVKSTCKNFNSEYRQKLLDHAKQSTTDALKTVSKRATQNTAEATGDLIDNKIADKLKKVSKTSLQNNTETITSKHDKEIPKERYISLEETQKVIDDLRLL